MKLRARRCDIPAAFLRERHIIPPPPFVLTGVWGSAPPPHRADLPEKLGGNPLLCASRLWYHFCDECESRSHRLAEKFPLMARREPRHYLVWLVMVSTTKEISVFVDESGSFDSSSCPSRYYLVCLLFHDQSVAIDEEVKGLAESLSSLGLPPDHCVHAGPLVRREQDYAGMTREERRQVFARMMAFIRRLEITYTCFAVDKKFITQTGAIHDALLQQMVRFLVDDVARLGSYDSLKVYYDNGQAQVKDLLREAFAVFSSKTDFVTEVSPVKYRLFQAADLLCTLELARIKLELEHRLFESEIKFFGSIQNLKKHYLKPMSRKRCQGE